MLRIGSIRFTAFYFAAFYTGLVASGHNEPFWIALILFLSLLNCLGVELANRYADRIEDEINRPVRTAMCAEFGFERIKRIAFWIYALQAPVYIVWFIEWQKTDLFLIQVVSWLTAWNYSVGLRFKARKFGVLAVLTGTFILPFCFGWAIHANIFDMPPILFAVPIFVISIAGIKDITDVEGDLERGYESAFVRLMQLRSILPLLFSLSLPYFLIAALVFFQQAEAVFLGLLALSPLSLLFGVMARGAQSDEEKAAVREWMYHFWFVFLVTTMGMIHSETNHLIALAVTSAFWIVATRKLHWTIGLRRDQASAAITILRRSLT
jgi:4-hydroxybenzoate polyprenyltransferase